ncbi:MAG: hypothetical protein ACI94O_002188, partial [Octadecabacter sp.]
MNVNCANTTPASVKKSLWLVFQPDTYGVIIMANKRFLSQNIRGN